MLMKKVLLSSIAGLFSLTLLAQCNQLFISEYVVGTGNNKAYELYNPTNAPINLSGYVMERWSNGENNVTDFTILAGTIPAYGTWVVANGQTEDIDLGTFVSPACSPDLQALADQLDNPYPAPTYMNGNDALLLIKDESIICDIFGKPGEDPGIAWQAPDGTFITSGHTMVRKQDVTGGVTTLPLVFDPLAQWDTLAIDTWTNLGWHDCECDPTLSANENKKPVDVRVYPNPVTDGGFLTVETNETIARVEIFDLTGKLVSTQLRGVNAEIGRINLKDLNTGVYILNVYMTNNVTFSTQVVKQ
jgi:predicted extracellular nuclease